MALMDVEAPEKTTTRTGYSAATEQFLTRYAVKPTSITAEPIVYEYTKDPALTHQYYQLRYDVFGRTWGLNHFGKDEDDNDRRGHIFVARKGKLVIGGFRIIVREPGEEFKMPMEIKGFDLRDALPEFDLRNHRHAEISRIAIDEDYNNPEVLANFVWHMLLKCIELDLEYAFSFSKLHICRLWRRVANSFGVLKAEISDTIFPPMPDICEGLFKFHLMTLVRNPDYSFESFKMDLEAITAEFMVKH